MSINKFFKNYCMMAVESHSVQFLEKNGNKYKNQSQEGAKNGLTVHSVSVSIKFVR